MDTKHFEELLLAEQKVLEGELQALGHKSENQDNLWDVEQKNSADTADREDVAFSIEEYEQNTETARKLETQLHEVVHALEKITTGTYGTCETDGGSIEEDRLESNPSARACKAHMNL